MITIDPRILLLIISIAVLQIALLLFTLWDWLKQGESLQNRYIWLILILLLEIIGPVLYFLIAPRNAEVSIENDQ